MLNLGFNEAYPDVLNKIGDLNSMYSDVGLVLSSLKSNSIQKFTTYPTSDDN